MLIDVMKEILFYCAFICGSVIIISGIGVITFRMCLLVLEHIKIGNVIREGIMLYIEKKRESQVVKLKDAEIVLEQQRKQAEVEEGPF